MNFKCPVDYKIEDCSSKDYGLTCDTCYHIDKDISFYMKEYAKLSIIDSLSYNYIREETQQKLNQIIDIIEARFSKEEIRNYIANNYNLIAKSK